MKNSATFGLARTRSSAAGRGLSALVATVLVATALLALSAAGSPISSGPLPGSGGAGHGAKGSGRFQPEPPAHFEPGPLHPGFTPTWQDPAPHPVPKQTFPSAIPEPGTWLLFALGLAGLLGLRGVRKSRAP